MPTDTWDLAVVELVYYSTYIEGKKTATQSASFPCGPIPSSIPILYLLWTYRKTALIGWSFMFIFLLLQIIGSGMIVSAGEYGHPSNIATILISVGLSPLIVGVGGVLHGWAKAKGLYKSKKSKRWIMIIDILYHLAVGAAIAIYATGQTQAHQPSKEKTGQTMAEAGILLLLVLLLFLVAYFIILIVYTGAQPMRPLVYAIAISLLLLTIRLMYQCVAVFRDYEPKYNPTTGSIALRVIFEFLPGALILLALVTGGVMSGRKQKEISETPRTDIPLRSNGERKVVV